MTPPASFMLNFEREVKDSERQLLRLATSLMGSEADAWDAYQEALIRAYTRLAQFRGDARFSTWLCRILYRTCYDELRRRRRRPLPLGWAAPGEGDAPAPGESRPGTDAYKPEAEAAPDPAAVAEQREIQRSVRRAVDNLSAPYREVVWMRDLEGLTYEEIAAALRLPSGTVKSRLNRARARLKDYLERTPA